MERILLILIFIMIQQKGFLFAHIFKKMIKRKLIGEAPTQDFMIFNKLSGGGAESGIHFIKKKSLRDQ